MKKALFAIVSAIIMLSGCQPKPSAKDLKRLLVTTDYNSKAIFSNYSTYTMLLDTMSYFDNTDSNAADTIYATSTSDSTVHYIAATVKEKLDSLGYSFVSKNSSPDLWIYIYVNIVHSAYLTTYYSPYGYGYGYYGSYGGYYPSINVTVQGDFYIFMYDIKHKTAGPYLWACDIGDILSSQDRGTAFSTSLNQVFKQSPYLKK